MKYVYLIESESVCASLDSPEVIEAWSTKEFAEMRVEQLNKKDRRYTHYIRILPLDITEEAALQCLYGKE